VTTTLCYINNEDLTGLCTVLLCFRHCYTLQHWSTTKTPATNNQVHIWLKTSNKTKRYNFHLCI